MLPTRDEAPDLYAGSWRRSFALLLDIFLVYLFGAVALVGLSAIPAVSNAMAGDYALPLSMLLVFWLYFALWESSRLQGTPLKAALGMAVTDTQGMRISFLRATARFFGKLLSTLTCLLGFLLADATARHQTLHDLMAGTLVVRGKELEKWRAAEKAGTPMPAAPKARTASVKRYLGMSFSVVVLALIGYWVFRIISDSNELRAFCDTVQPGQSRAQVEATVNGRGYVIRYLNDEQGNHGLVYDRKSLYRNVCMVEYSNEQVKSAHYRPFD